MVFQFTRCHCLPIVIVACHSHNLLVDAANLAWKILTDPQCHFIPILADLLGRGRRLFPQEVMEYLQNRDIEITDDATGEHDFYVLIRREKTNLANTRNAILINAQLLLQMGKTLSDLRTDANFQAAYDNFRIFLAFKFVHETSHLINTFIRSRNLILSNGQWVTPKIRLIDGDIEQDVEDLGTAVELRLFGGILVLSTWVPNAVRSPNFDFEIGMLRVEDPTVLSPVYVINLTPDQVMHILDGSQLRIFPVPCPPPLARRAVAASTPVRPAHRGSRTIIDYNGISYTLRFS